MNKETDAKWRLQFFYLPQSINNTRHGKKLIDHFINDIENYIVSEYPQIGNDGKLSIRLSQIPKEVFNIKGGVNGLVVAVECSTGIISYSICSKKDKFNKKFGRIRSALLMSEKLAYVDPYLFKGRVRLLKSVKEGDKYFLTSREKSQAGKEEDIRHQYSKMYNKFYPDQITKGDIRFINNSGKCNCLKAVNSVVE